jgi:hypothetical protein
VHRAADRAFALPMETECKPLPLSLAEFLVVPLGLAVWCFALNGFPLDWHVLPSPRAVGWSRPEVQLTRKGC